ncbi:hypothetical protein [Streptomyces sp. CB02923]|uniref:hypothetical protein n=1 Tax=Streptomyces sp. CB02923 TaxID=1718985 RepID=UPI001901E0CC|nr:hypothetical protein [Streptomyces sp. CB02923]
MPTDSGLTALRRIRPYRGAFTPEAAEQLGDTVDFHTLVEAVETLSHALDNLGY